MLLSLSSPSVHHSLRRVKLSSLLGKIVSIQFILNFYPTEFCYISSKFRPVRWIPFVSEDGTGTMEQ